MARIRDSKEGEGLEPAYATNHGINGDDDSLSWLFTDLAELVAHSQLKRLAA